MNGLLDVIADLDLGLDAHGRWFRADRACGIELKEGKPSIDREAGIIFGYSVISKGPALGHDMDIDDTTLGQVVELGNAAKMGIKSRFDHPSASNTSMGTFLGRTKNFRRSGDRVIGDLHLSESAKEAPQGDLYTYVIGLAERDPSAFGASIVFDGTSELPLNDDGTRKKGPDGKPLPALARVKRLLASDVVDEPAANPDGLFDTGEQGQSLAAKVSSFLNRWAQQSLVPQLLSAIREGSSMDNVITAEQLTAARKEGEAAERARTAGIMTAFTKVWGAEPPASETKVRDGMIELGASVEDAEKSFRVRKLTMIEDAAPISTGGGSGDEVRTDTKVDLSTLPQDERIKAEWDGSPALRTEFSSFNSYAAYRRNEEAGNIKILKNKESK